MELLSEGAKLICAKRPRTSEEWDALIETRRRALKPRLAEMRLPRLGDYRLESEEFGMGHSLNSSEPEVRNLSKRTIFTTTGIAMPLVFCHCRIDESGSREILFLTQKAEWIRVIIQFDKYRPGGSSGSWIERATNVLIQETKLASLFSELKAPDSQVRSIGMKEIFDRLGEVAEEWYKRQAARYTTAKRLVETFKLEDELFEALRHREA